MVCPGWRRSRWVRRELSGIRDQWNKEGRSIIARPDEAANGMRGALVHSLPIPIGEAISSLSGCQTMAGLVLACGGKETHVLCRMLADDQRPDDDGISTTDLVDVPNP